MESSSSGVAILSAPIEVLRTHALEVLIVPGATTPTTSPVFFLPNGRMIDVPVHKAVEYLGTGAAGLGRLLSSAVSVAHEKRNGTTIKSIVGLEKMEPVDITATVRSVRSLSNPDMDGARTWLLAGTTTTGEPIKPAVAAFIRDVLREAVEELSVVKPSVAASDIPVEELGAAIATWTASAHSSLKLDLEDAGFGSKFWHKIDWWKLLWRVDDVGHVARYVISEHFLRKDEGDAVFLSGRIFQAGAEGKTVADFTPRDIAHERDDIIRELIPGLQIAAQRALGRMLEIAAASSGGGALLAVGGADLLIAGAAAGVGVLGGLAHLRKRWDHEKREFEQAVQERGRVVVLETERWAWDRLRAVELAARPKLERSEEEELRRQVEEALVVLDALDHRPADV